MATLRLPRVMSPHMPTAHTLSYCFLSVTFSVQPVPWLNSPTHCLPPFTSLVGFWKFLPKVCRAKHRKVTFVSFSISPRGRRWASSGSKAAWPRAVCDAPGSLQYRHLSDTLMNDWFSKGPAQTEYYREDQRGWGYSSSGRCTGGCEAGSGQQVAAR